MFDADLHPKEFGMKINRGVRAFLREPVYADVKQGDVFEVIDATQPPLYLRTSTGLVNLNTGYTYTADHIMSYVRVRIYPNATLHLEPSVEHPLA